MAAVDGRGSRLLKVIEIVIYVHVLYVQHLLDKLLERI